MRGHQQSVNLYSVTDSVTDSCGQENTGALKKKKCNHVPHELFFMMSVQPNHRTLSPFNTI